jgi:DNA polymerase III epsilon subunit-like protein
VRFLIGDTETTGLGPGRAAVEVGLIEIDPDTLEILGEIGSIVNPLKPIDPTAAAIHGITDEEAAMHPTLPEYIQDTLDGPLDGDLTLIGYRVGFDLPLLRPFGNIVKTFDVLPLAQSLVRDAANHKLQTLKEHFNLPGGDAHRALGDCHTTLQLLAILLPLSGRSLRMHCATDFQMIHHLPWGKHEGRPLVSVPKSYRDWMLRECELDSNLRKSLELLAKTEKT